MAIKKTHLAIRFYRDNKKYEVALCSGAGFGGVLVQDFRRVTCDRCRVRYFKFGMDSRADWHDKGKKNIILPNWNDLEYSNLGHKVM